MSGVCSLALFCVALSGWWHIDIPTPPDSDFATEIAFSTDGNKIAVRGFQFLRVWEISEEKVVLDRFLGGRDGGPISFSDDARELIYGFGCGSENMDTGGASRDAAASDIHFLDLETEEETRVSLDSGGHCISLSPNGKLVASTADGRLFLSDSETGKTVQELGAQSGGTGVLGAAFSRSGSLFTCADPLGRVYVWEVLTGRKVREFQDELVRESGHKRVRVGNLALSPDDRHLAWTAAHFVRVWSIADGKQSWSSRIDPAFSITFSSDGRFLAILTSDEWSIWDVASGKEVSRESIRTEEHWDRPRASALSRDFRIVAWGYKLESLYLRELASNGAPRLMTHHTAAPLLAVQLQLLVILSVPILALLSLALPIVAIVATVKASRELPRPRGRKRLLGHVFSGLGILGLVVWLLVAVCLVTLGMLTVILLGFAGKF